MSLMRNTVSQGMATRGGVGGGKGTESLHEADSCPPSAPTFKLAILWQMLFDYAHNITTDGGSFTEVHGDFKIST